MKQFQNYLNISNGILYDLSNCNDSETMIYHYTGIDGFKSIIENSTLRFTDRFFLNDYTEGYYVLDLFKDNIDTILQEINLIQEKDYFLKECQNYKNKIEENYFKIYQMSFSLDKDSLCLWNYYTKGDCIKGFNIGFTIKELLNCIELDLKNEEKKPYIFCGKVEYDKKQQIEKITNYISRFYNSMVEDNKHKPNFSTLNPHQFKNRFESILSRLILLGTFFKSPCFSVENEYRLAIDLHIDKGEFSALNNKRNFFNRNGVLVPYVDLTFPTDKIKSIMISPTYDYESTQRNIKLFLENKNIDNINIEKSSIPVRY